MPSFLRTRGVVGVTHSLLLPVGCQHARTLLLVILGITRSSANSSFGYLPVNNLNRHWARTRLRSAWRSTAFYANGKLL